MNLTYLIIFLQNVVKNKEDVMPVEPTVVIKEEPIQSYPERLASEDKDVKDIGDSVPVVSPVVIKEQAITFEPEACASADIVIKDEFVICTEDDIVSSADVPPSTEPISHVTLSVACLGFGRKSPIEITTETVTNESSRRSMPDQGSFFRVKLAVFIIGRPSLELYIDM
ncbi:hypothetical protein CDAR_16391 [Caerostris darwini]|uniref:Uncharacterized protein n=1 Tax=Caerostris darwini TaxID=1538125 RepID=A0AAV4WT91_9ARAC|nr:hypothetical protein CDAR_16391 [Caerostris darwini]